ncbi:polysaccharide deacetylase [Bacteroidia bacterium]|nr:polysaccharide deacetylase [Bacteroidia bacterium]
MRLNRKEKVIHLIFSADTRFEGAIPILKTLKTNKAKASFFLTGNCLRMQEMEPLIRNIQKDGHYIGGHSDNHLLYASWDNRQETLVSKDSLLKDLCSNLAALEKYGIVNAVSYFLPPYEWYNQETVAWLESQGQWVINFTPGIRTAADYTTPDMPGYKSSQALIDQLYQFEKEQSLNGAIILIHPGTESARTDKLYLRLNEIIQYLKKKGYRFERLLKIGVDK